MKVTLINHSSLLINIEKNIILTDFWNLSPAFGSWLPSALPFYNPVYLASLSYNKNFYLALSHAHDDHLDDEFLKKYFNKDTNIIINEFPGPSLKNRLKKLGFKNFISLTENIKKLNGFDAISVFDNSISNDDCSILFRDKKHCVHHGNDNWFEIKNKNIKKIKKFSQGRKLLYCAQANSASGYPLTYPQFGSEKNRIFKLEEKVKNMVLSSFKNIKKINANYFLPYAGYAKPYVKDHNYEEITFNPTFQNLKKILSKEKITNLNKMLNIFCGGTFDFSNEKVTYPFEFDPDKLIKITDKFVKQEKYINKCDTYRLKKNDKIIKRIEIKNYLIKFNKFVLRYLEKYPKFYSSIIGKMIAIEVIDAKRSKDLIMKIGSGKFLKNNVIPNKKLKVEKYLLKALIDKKIVFENLYGGYEAEFFRYPIKKYNRDIATYLIMFGYFYKNSKI